MSSRRLLLACWGALAAAASLAGEEPLLARALAAEARLDSRAALELFLQLERERPDDAFVLQKVAQQYSDAIVDLTDVEDKRRHARAALAYAERAAALAPEDAVNALSVAIAHGKLATYSDTRAKVKYSRLVKEEAERALRLDPEYAWAHHVLGRWHREVAELGATARFFVKLFYGGLPNASVVSAVAHLERAVTLDPENLNHHLELGFAYAAAGRGDDARRAWRQGLALPERGKHDAAAKRRAQAALERAG